MHEQHHDVHLEALTAPTFGMHPGCAARHVKDIRQALQEITDLAGVMAERLRQCHTLFQTIGQTVASGPADDLTKMRVGDLVAIAHFLTSDGDALRDQASTAVEKLRGLLNGA